MTDMLLVFSTFASEEDAARVVRALVAGRLAACGTLLPGARSLYLWKDAIADEREVVVLLKTRRERWPALEARLRGLHPYETPECVAVEVAEGSPAYLDWLASSLGSEGTAGA